MEVGRKDHVIARGVEVRSPAHGPESRELLGVGPIDVGRVDFGRRSVFAEASPTEPLAIGREEGSSIVTEHVGDSANIRSIGIHDIKIQGDGRIVSEEGLLTLAEGFGVGLSIRGEGDELAIRAVGSFCIVPEGFGQFFVSP